MHAHSVNDIEIGNTFCGSKLRKIMSNRVSTGFSNCDMHSNENEVKNGGQLAIEQRFVSANSCF